MKIDGTHFCDHCCVEFNLKRFAVHALFGTLLCEDCDNAIERKAPPKIPANKKLMAYVRKVEKGDAKPPWTSLSIKKNGKPMCVPIPLTAAGKPK